MPRIDRRRSGDRRRNDRHKVAIKVEWENADGRHDGTINDISMSGCFLMSGGDVKDRDPVTIYFPASDGRMVEVSGEILNHVFEVGFGVRFINLSDLQIVLLHRLMEAIEKD